MHIHELDERLLTKALIPPPAIIVVDVAGVVDVVAAVTDVIVGTVDANTVIVVGELLTGVVEFALVVESWAEYVPCVVYMWVGFWEVLIGVPSPKFQLQLVGEFVLVSLKVTVNGAGPDVGVAVNCALAIIIYDILKIKFLEHKK